MAAMRRTGGQEGLCTLVLLAVCLRDLIDDPYLVH